MAKKVRKLKETAQLGTLVSQGFKYSAARQYIAYKRKYGSERLSQNKRLLSVWPYNGVYERIFEDIFSTRKVIGESCEAFPLYYATSLKIDGEKRWISLQNESYRETLSCEELIQLLKQKGTIIVRKCKNDLETKVNELQYENDTFFINRKEVTYQRVLDFFKKMPVASMCMEKVLSGEDIKLSTGFQEPVLHISYLYKAEKDEERMDAYFAEHRLGNRISLYSDIHLPLGEWETDARILAAKGFVLSVIERFQDIKYMSLSFIITETGYRLLQIDTGLDLLFQTVEDKDMMENVGQKNVSISPAKHVYGYAFAAYAQKKGFVYYMYRYWTRSLQEDQKYSRTSKAEKKWAHDKGFYSYRIEQYGLNDDNYKEFLSDYNYKRLRPLNGNFRKLLTDKILTYHLLSPFSEHVPQYYYKIYSLASGVKIISFSGEKKEELSVENIIQLLERKKKLVCKRAIGSHGEGFFKCEYDDLNQSFFINEKQMTRDEVKDFFLSRTATCFISEYIEMHDSLKRIYDKVACTVRIMTIDDHKNANVKHAYFKIGTNSTGLTDNVSAGGIVAKVNIETGELYDPELIENHTFYPCPIHPDSQEPICGTLPHWNLVKEKVEEISNYLFPLEYLGFDVVITNDGFKILEINTHQDLHKYPEYPQDVKDYFNRKLEERNFK